MEMVQKDVWGSRSRRQVRRSWLIGSLVFITAGAAFLVTEVAGSVSATAAQPAVGMGTAATFAVLAGTTVTNTGPSVVSGDLGLSPGSAVTGFPPGTVAGTKHIADASAVQAKSDLVTAYNDAAGRTPATVVSADLGGQMLAPGVYQTATALGLTGTVTLNGQGNTSSVFIFQAGSTLITASGSTVQLIGGAQACNVFWQVGSSVTLGTGTTFAGSILALTSATIQTGTTVSGRVLARNGAVSLDTSDVAVPSCNAAPIATTTTTGVPVTTTTTAVPTTTTTATVPVTTTTTTAPATTTTLPTSSGGPSVTTTTSPPPGAVSVAASAAAVGTPSPPAASTPAVIPVGAPQTGMGGMAHSVDAALVTVGALALVGAGLAGGQAIRRRPPRSERRQQD